MALTEDPPAILQRLESPPVSRGTFLHDALATARCRVNGIWGGRDAPSLPDIAAREATLRTLQPALRFRVIEDAGHWVAYEAADVFNATLDALLIDPTPLSNAAESV